LNTETNLKRKPSQKPDITVTESNLKIKKNPSLISMTVENHYKDLSSNWAGSYTTIKNRSNNTKTGIFNNTKAQSKKKLQQFNYDYDYVRDFNIANFVSENENQFHNDHKKTLELRRNYYNHNDDTTNSLPISNTATTLNNQHTMKHEHTLKHQHVIYKFIILRSLLDRI